MKRGPDHSQKADECNPSPAQVALGIPEIVATILHHYPRYGLRGQNNLVTVSTVWHEAMKQCHLQDEPTFEKLLAECLKCPEGVIHILRDDTVLPYLSEEKILRLISCHSEFAFYLLENDVLPINQKNLMILTKHHAQVAMHLLTNPGWRQKLQNINIYKIGCQHPETAQYILDNNMRSEDNESIRREGLKTLAESSLVIARRLLNDPATLRYLTEPNLKGPLVIYQYLELLIEFGKTNESFSSFQPEIKSPEDFINHFEALCKLGVSAYELMVLGGFHAEIALKALQSETIFERFPAVNKKLTVNYWARKHEIVAMTILETESLCENLTNSELADLCKSHSAAAKHVFSTPLLCERLYIGDFVRCIHPRIGELAMDILKLDIFHRHLNAGALIDVALSNPHAAKVILTTKEFNTKLSAVDIVLIHKKYPQMVRKILNTQSLRELLEPMYFELLEVMNRYFIIQPFVIEVSAQAKGWDLESNKPSEEMDVDAVAKFCHQR